MWRDVWLRTFAIKASCQHVHAHFQTLPAKSKLQIEPAAFFIAGELVHHFLSATEENVDVSTLSYRDRWRGSAVSQILPSSSSHWQLRKCYNKWSLKSSRRLLTFPIHMKVVLWEQQFRRSPAAQHKVTFCHRKHFPSLRVKHTFDDVKLEQKSLVTRI